MNDAWLDNPGLKPDGDALRVEMFRALDAALEIESRFKPIIEAEADRLVITCSAPVEQIVGEILELLNAEMLAVRESEDRLRTEILGRPAKECEIIQGIIQSLLTDCNRSRKPTIGCSGEQPQTTSTNLPNGQHSVAVPVISNTENGTVQKIGGDKPPTLPPNQPYVLPDPPGGSSLQDYYVVGIGDGTPIFLAGFPRDFYDWKSGNPIWFSLTETPVSFVAVPILSDAAPDESSVGVLFGNYGQGIRPEEAENYLKSIPIDTAMSSLLGPLEVWSAASKRWGEVEVRNLWSLLGISIPVLVESPDWRRDNMPRDDDGGAAPARQLDGGLVGDGDQKAPQVFVENRIELPRQSEVSLPGVPDLSDLVRAGLDLIAGRINDVTAAQLCRLTRPLGLLLGVDHNQFPPCVSLSEMIRRRG